MNQDQINEVFKELKKSSMVSILLVFFSTIIIIGCIVFSATRLTPLEKEVDNLRHEQKKLRLEISLLEKKIIEKQKKIDYLENDIALRSSSISNLENGISFLLSRNYQDAIEQFNFFIKANNNTSEIFNLIGYSEFRHAIQLAKTMDNTNKLKIEELLALSEQHLKKAIGHAKSPDSKAWAEYNLSILLFTKRDYENSISHIKTLIHESPLFINNICNDGQFRKFVINNSTKNEFEKVLRSKMPKNNPCWVIDTPVK